MNATVLNAPLVSDWTDHLVVLPIVLPIAVAGAMFLMDERRSRLKGALSLATVLALLGISLILVWRASEAAQIYRLGNWAAPYGIVLVADRALGPDAGARQRAGPMRPGLLLRPLGPGGSALPRPVPPAADGRERRLPHRRPVQPVRVLRGDAGRLLRSRPARIGRDADTGRPRLHRGQPRRLAVLPRRRQPHLRHDGNPQHGRPRPAARGAGGGGTRFVRDRLRDPRHRLPDQVQRLAARVLAAHHLRGSECAGGRDPRDS